MLLTQTPRSTRDSAALPARLPSCGRSTGSSSPAGARSRPRKSSTALPTNARSTLGDDLTKLDEDDLIQLADGVVEIAYPFSARPTPFVVRLRDQRERFVCCAIDALGMASMVGDPVDVLGRCHHCGDSLSLDVHPEGPGPLADGVMVWVGRRCEGERGPPRGSERCSTSSGRKTTCGRGEAVNPDTPGAGATVAEAFKWDDASSADFFRESTDDEPTGDGVLVFDLTVVQRGERVSFVSRGNVQREERGRGRRRARRDDREDGADGCAGHHRWRRGRSWGSTGVACSGSWGSDYGEGPLSGLWRDGRATPAPSSRRPGGVSQLRGASPPAPRGRRGVGGDARPPRELPGLWWAADAAREDHGGRPGRVLRPTLSAHLRVRSVRRGTVVGGPCGVIAGSLSARAAAWAGTLLSIALLPVAAGRHHARTRP